MSVNVFCDDKGINMSASVNKVILLGNLGRDPEFKTTGDGQEFVTFSLATSESWTDKATNERREKTEWHNIVIFSRGLIKFAKYLTKASKVLVEGRLQTRRYTDSNGVEKYTTEVVIQPFEGNLVLLDPKPKNMSRDDHDDGHSGKRHDFKRDNDSMGGKKSASVYDNGSASDYETDDELPF